MPDIHKLAKRIYECMAKSKANAWRSRRRMHGEVEGKSHGEVQSVWHGAANRIYKYLDKQDKGDYYGHHRYFFNV